MFTDHIFEIVSLHLYIKLPIVTSNYSYSYYAHECPIIPELFSLKLQPIIPKIMLAYYRLRPNKTYLCRMCSEWFELIQKAKLSNEQTAEQLTVAVQAQFKVGTDAL